MKRRDFIRKIAVGAGAGAVAGASSFLYATPSSYNGRLFVQWQMDGGWDVTSLCDPKVNQRGEAKINNWADRGDIQEAGSIAYAPFASNQRLFKRFHKDMLVINGVDAQTNSHSTGIIHNWSGRSSEGMPTLAAMFAAKNTPEQPLSYLSFGGYASTAGLIRFNRLDDPTSLINVLNPNNVPWQEQRNLRSAPELDRIARFQRQSVQRKLDSSSLTPRQRDNLEAHLLSLDTRDGLKRLVDILPPPEDLQGAVPLGGDLGEVNTLSHIQMTLLAFKAGLGSSSDLVLGGFDTHRIHDEQHASLFHHFADALEYFWNYAEQLGIADRITLLIGSDFGRTPIYNADQGKDHWPIGSYIVMEQGANWTNRVVGLTDEGHNAIALDPDTARPDRRGTHIYPKHVHNALRRYLGVEGLANRSGFRINANESFDFFDPQLRSRA